MANRKIQKPIMQTLVIVEMAELRFALERQRRQRKKWDRKQQKVIEQHTEEDIDPLRTD